MTRMLTSGEVAVLAGVVPATVRYWARTGKLSPVLTCVTHGHRRYREDEVRALIAKRSR